MLEAQAADLRQKLAERHGSEAAALWERGWEVAWRAHGRQLNPDASPFLTHLLRVANILFEWGLEPDVVVAGLLHDLDKALHRQYGPLPSEQVAEIVECCVRLSSIDPVAHYACDPKARQRIFEALLTDVRPILVRCASRLDNMRHFSELSPLQQKLVVRNTAEVYVPLVYRMGLYGVYREMEDLCLYYGAPDEYETVRTMADQWWRQHGEEVEALCERTQEALQRAGLAIVRIFPDRQHYEYLHRRLLQAGMTEETSLEALDPRWFFVIVVLLEDLDACYRALGAVHSLGTPTTVHFHDYLADPRPHGYAALRTGVAISRERESWICRFALLTPRLHELDRRGITFGAAYRLWRTGQLPPEAEQWHLLERQAVEALVRSLRNRTEERNEIVVFTPQGDAVTLPAGATALDFAYKIHSDLGRSARRARVNGRLVPLSEELRYGDVVEIEKDPARQYPDPIWEQWATTEAAKRKIRAQLNRRPEVRGRRRLEKALKRRGRLLDAAYESRAAAVAREMGYRDLNELYRLIAVDELDPNEVVNFILYVPEQAPPSRTFELHPEDARRVPRWDPSSLRFASCCSPEATAPELAGVLVGDGFIAVHRPDCERLASFPPTRRVRLVTRHDRRRSPQVAFYIRAHDRVGLLHDIVSIVRDANLNMLRVEAYQENTMGVVRFTTLVNSEVVVRSLADHFWEVQGVVEVRVNEQRHTLRPKRGEHLSAPVPPLIQPFSPGRPVDDPERFVGRTEELNVLRDHLLSSSPPGSLLVQGPRRIGKTSLVKYLRALPEISRRYRHVFVDFSDIRGENAMFCDPALIIRRIARRVARERRTEQRVMIPPLDAFQEDAVGTFVEFLDHLLGTKAQKPFLLAFDELGIFHEWAQRHGAADQFFYWLRSLMQHEPRLVFLFATSDDVVDLLHYDGIYEILNVTTTVSLGPLAEANARELISRPLRGEVFFDRGVLDQIVRVTGRHPFYLQILGASLVSYLNNQRRRDVLRRDVERIVEHLVETISEATFRHLWNEGDHHQVLVLSALAAAPAYAHARGEGAPQVQRRLAEHGVELPPERVEAALETLVRRQTLQRQWDERQGCFLYSFAVDLFRRWFARHYPLNILVHTTA